MKIKTIDMRRAGDNGITEFDLVKEALKSDRKYRKNLVYRGFDGYKIPRLLKKGQDTNEELLFAYTEKELLEKEGKEKFRIFHHLENEVNTLRQEQQAVQKKQLDATQDEGRIRAQVQEKTVRLETSQERLSQLEAQVVEKKAALQTEESQVKERRQKVESLSQSIDGLKQESSELIKERASFKESADEQQKRLQSLVHTSAELEARKKSLLRLREEGEGLPSGSKHLLKEARNPKSVLFGKVEGLFEHILPKKGFETHIATALRHYAETLVVRTVSDLSLVLQVAAEKKWKDFSLICLDHILIEKNVGQSTQLLAHVEPSSLAVHFLKAVSLSESVASMLENGHKAETIYQDGYSVDHKGVLAHVSPGKEETNTFLREAELKTLEEKILALMERRNEEEQQQALFMQTRAELEEKLRLKEEERRKQDMHLVQENFALQRLLADIERGKKERVAFEEQLQKIRSSSEEYRVLLEQLKVDLKNAQQQYQRVFEHNQELDKKLPQHVMALKEAKEAHLTCEQQFRQVQGELHRLQNEIKVFEAQDVENQRHRRKQDEELQFNRTKCKEASSRLHTLGAEIKAYALELEEMKAAYEEVVKEVKRRKVEQEEIEKLSANQRLLLSQLESSRHQFEIAMAEDSITQKNIEKELLERFQLTVEQAKKMAWTLEGTLDEAEKVMRHLRSEIEKAGAVNLASIEACKEHEERFLFLDKQLNDLESTKKDLEQIIGKLDGESRKLFKSTFETIRKNFQKNFPILFNGGEADLTFTESADVLEAGVEIFARPPGKQMRSISLMSGGEKCLTALALLFSIFEVRPAPFCILDEVDAPLDDSNIGRFIMVLKQFIHKTQFIIVTHNKKTMATADVLFGVSMEEKGVSKLISLAFEKRHQLEVSR